MRTEEEDMAGYLQAIAHPTRIRILRLLLAYETLHVEAIRNHLPGTVTRQLQHHLRELRAERIVLYRRGSEQGREGRRDGNYHYYFLCERERVQRILESSGQPIAFNFSER